MKTRNELIYALERLRDRDDGDARGAMAALRRGMGRPPGEISEASRIVQPMLDMDAPQWVEDTMYIIAPLFAFHRAPYDGDPGTNIGDHFRALSDEDGEPPRSVERRFMALLAAEPDELPDALRQAVSLLKSKDVPVNWRELFDDVGWWLDRRPEGEGYRQRVRLKWSRRFWRLPARKDAPDAQQQPQPN